MNQSIKHVATFENFKFFITEDAYSRIKHFSDEPTTVFLSLIWSIDPEGHGEPHVGSYNEIDNELFLPVKVSGLNKDLFVRKTAVDKLDGKTIITKSTLTDEGLKQTTFAVAEP